MPQKLANAIPGITPATDFQSAERLRASSFIDKALTANVPPPAPNPQIYTANAPPSGVWGDIELQDDPHMEMAVQMMKMKYPQLFKGINHIFIGDKALQGSGISGTYSDWDNGVIRLRHSGGNFDQAIDTLRHELSHANGADDKMTSGQDPKAAYDVGYASSQLHNDIYLRPEKGKK